MSQLRDELRRLTILDWLVIGLGFLCAFLLALQSAFENAGVLRVLALICGLGALGVLAYLLWSRRTSAVHGRDWNAFAAALPDGVAIDVPDGMSYARELDQLAEELTEIGEPPYDGSPGHARHAVFGEHERIHYCAFQYHHSGQTDTVGLVALRPDREVDVVPDVWVAPAFPTAPAFPDRFQVSGYDDKFVRELLSSDVQADLLAADPFSWALVGNQIITFREGPSDPKSTFEFIDTRLELLASVADRLPTTAGAGTTAGSVATSGADSAVDR